MLNARASRELDLFYQPMLDGCQAAGIDTGLSASAFSRADGHESGDLLYTEENRQRPGPMRGVRTWQYASGRRPEVQGARPDPAHRGANYVRIGKVDRSGISP